MHPATSYRNGKTDATHCNVKQLLFLVYSVSRVQTAPDKFNGKAITELCYAKKANIKSPHLKILLLTIAMASTYLIRKKLKWQTEERNDPGFCFSFLLI